MNIISLLLQNVNSLGGNLMNTLKILCDHYCDNTADTPETKVLADKLVKGSNEKMWDTFLLIGNANLAERRQAFSAGFKAAMTLFINQDVVEMEDNV